MDFLASLLEEQGKLVEATPLRTEELEGRVLFYGMEHASLDASCGQEAGLQRAHGGPAGGSRGAG